jgi:hypothetical protein
MRIIGLFKKNKFSRNSKYCISITKIIQLILFMDTVAIFFYYYEECYILEYNAV